MLAPDGRAYFDTYNILSPEAWTEFHKIVEEFPPGHRPGHVSQFSTPQEMQKFMEETDFDSILIDGSNPQLVVALGRKPSQSGFQRPQTEFPQLNLIHAAEQGDSAQPVSLLEAIASLRTDIDTLTEAIYVKNSYIETLEHTLAKKDRHITMLESTVRKQQKTLTSVPVRLAFTARKVFMGRRRR